jgi:molecular chaperone DnaK (HSP70)
MKLYGEAAKAQIYRNAENTVYDSKRLIGRKFRDRQVQEGMQLWPFKVIQTQQGLPGIVVTWANEQKVYSCEEIQSDII